MLHSFNYSRAQEATGSFAQVVATELPVLENTNYPRKIKTRARSHGCLVSLNFLNAGSMKWLKEKRYLDSKKGKKRRILLFLTDHGREALHVLDDFFFAPLENPMLRINLGLEEEKEIVASLSGDPDNITKAAILSNSYIVDRILELSAALCNSLGEVSLRIDLSPTKEGQVVALLKILWSFYWQTLRKSRLNLLGPLYIDMHLTYEEHKRAYTEFWKKYLKTFLRFDGTTRRENMMFRGEKSWAVERPLFPLLPRQLESFLPIYIKDEKVKQWIEKRLEKDPDWFMPHFFWVKLGFKQSPRRRELDSVEQVSPPTFHETLASPKLPKEYAHFDGMIRYVVRKKDEESSKALCMWMAKSSDWRNQGFYESWRILRREQKTRIGEEQKLRDIVKILDAALLEYIIAEHNPNVDLQAAFNDYLVSEDVETVLREIKGGKYRIAWQTVRERNEVTRPKIGNLYGERKKAWITFLEKYYLNIEKSSRADGVLKVSKKILEEFAQYWKKEYWQEQNRRGR